MLKKLLAALAVGVAATTLPAVASDGSADDKRGESTSETQKASPAPSEPSSDRSAPDAGKEAGK